MDELKVVLEKKFEIYIVEEDIEELEDYDRIPLEIHDPIRDLGLVMSTVEKYGFCLISDMDSNNHVKLFLRTNFKRQGKTLWKLMLLLLHCIVLVLCLYILLIKLKL